MPNPSSSENLFADVLKAKAEQDAAETTKPTPTLPAVEEPDDEDEALQVTELAMLKSRARLMGISFSNNISAETLKGKINARLEGEALQENDDNSDNPDGISQDDEGQTHASAASANQNDIIAALEAQIATLKDSIIGVAAPLAPASIKESKIAAKQRIRQQLYAEQMKLVRVRIQNLNPAKKDLPGEIFTVANSFLGAVRKFVPYGEQTENGYHLPFIIYQQLKNREFLQIKVRKVNGKEQIETSMAREFALEVLPQLTTQELARLAATQAAAKGMD